MFKIVNTHKFLGLKYVKKNKRKFLENLELEFSKNSCIFRPKYFGCQKF